MPTISFDGSLKSIQRSIKEMQKSISLRQIAIQSGVNYITLRNILFGKQDRVTTKVSKKMETFYLGFDPKHMKEVAPRRGRKPISLSASTPALTTIKLPKSLKSLSTHPKISPRTISTVSGLIHLNTDNLIKEKKAELDFLMLIRTAQQGLKKSVPATV